VLPRCQKVVDGDMNVNLTRLYRNTIGYSAHPNSSSALKLFLRKTRTPVRKAAAESLNRGSQKLSDSVPIVLR